MTFEPPPLNMARSAGRVSRMLLRSVAVWFVLISAEVIHGIARALWLVPIVGDFRSRQIGVFTGSLMNLAIAAFFMRWIHPSRIVDALMIGITWLILTLTFEIAFGRAVVQASWQRIGSDYDLIHGGLLPIGLLMLALTPLITARARRPARFHFQPTDAHIPRGPKGE